MAKFNEKRSENRLEYNWSVWFAANFEDKLKEGTMHDLTSESASFLCQKSQSPQKGDKIILNFTIPRLDKECKSEGVSYSRSGIVCRVDDFKEKQNRVVLRFNLPLDMHPAEKTSVKLHL